MRRSVASRKGVWDAMDHVLWVLISDRWAILDFLEGGDVLEGQEQGVFPRERHTYASDPMSGRENRKRFWLTFKQARELQHLLKWFFVA